MRLFDTEQSAQTNIADSGQDIPDRPLNTFGSRERSYNSKFDGVRV